jgi:hypothetical protein
LCALAITKAPHLLPPAGQEHKAVDTPQPVKTGTIDKTEELKSMEEKELLQTKGAEELAPLLDAEDVARILKSSVKTVHKRVREGKLACVQASAKDRKFTREQVQDFIETQSTGVRVDKKAPKPLPSAPKKGGDNTESRREKTKDSWASLKKEMSRWT